MGWLTEHCHLKAYLFKLGLVESPRCHRCKWEFATATSCSWWLWGTGSIKN